MTPGFDDYEPAGLPEPEVLSPDKRTNILERCVGQTVSRLIEFEDGNPLGGRQCGLVFISSERPLFWAVPVPPYVGSPYQSVILPAWFERLRIITPRMYAAYRSDRRAAEVTPNELYRRIEGEIVLGFHWQDEVNRWGGETLRIELTGGGSCVQDFLVHAGPPVPAADPAQPPEFTASYILQLRPNPTRRVVFRMPGLPGAPN